MKTVVVTGGGTGGHLFPAIAVGEKLLECNIAVHLITDNRCKRYLSGELKLTTHIIDLYLRSSLIYKFIGLFQVARATVQSILKLHKIKPHLVIGFGGYPTFPIMLAAVILRIPIALHEQNSVFGKANRFFTKFASLIALSYAETKNIDSRAPNVKVLGSIVRNDIAILPTKEFDHEEFNLLVFAGSQGGTLFSQMVNQALLMLRQLMPNLKLMVTQQVPAEELPAIQARYDAANIDCNLAPFFHNMHELYAKADLAITRAGASTIAELAASGLPAIFIPYPYAAESHQLHNAQMVAESGGGWFVEQRGLAPEKLTGQIIKVIKDRELLKSASIALKAQQINGAYELANTVEKIIERF